jgi:hypothetical protein
MKLWPEVRDRDFLKDILGDSHAVKVWTKVLQLNYDGYDTWDYAWTFTCWIQGSLSIISNVIQLLISVLVRRELILKLGNLYTVICQQKL